MKIQILGEQDIQNYCKLLLAGFSMQFMESFHADKKRIERMKCKIFEEVA
jgi:hypothetical protein